MTPPFPSSALCAQRADKAMLAYITTAHCGVEEGLGNLLRDLMSWSNVCQLDFHRALKLAETQFAEISAGRGQ